MLTWFDLILLAITIICIVLGAWRGLLREGLGLLVWIIALVTARFYCNSLAYYLKSYVQNSDLRIVISFFAIAFLIVFLGGLCVRLLHTLLHWAGMASFNRLLGAIFGAIKAGLIIGLIGIIIPLTPIKAMPAWQNAQFKPLVINLQEFLLHQYHRIVQ